MYEPPFVAEGTSGQEPDHVAVLRQLIDTGKRGAAVKYFLGDMVRAPKPMVFMMQLMVPVWSKLKAVAHTLPYDATIMGTWAVPTQRAAQVRVPTLVMHGGKTDARLSRAADALAAALPNAQSRVLAGQTHNAAATAVAPVLRAFFLAETAAVSSQVPTTQPL
jgi:pimeloyl-ACP methyl ester carboxylesterase